MAFEDSGEFVGKKVEVIRKTANDSIIGLLTSIEENGLLMVEYENGEVVAQYFIPHDSVDYIRYPSYEE